MEAETTRGGGSDERQRQEPCNEWTRDGGVTRDGGGATRCNATTSWRGKQEAEVLADKRWQRNKRASLDAMKAGDNNDD